MSSCNKDQPFTWKKYNKNLCQTCQAVCCTMPVEVDAQDLVRLKLITEDEIEFSFKKIISKLKKQKWIKNYNHKTSKFTLSQNYGDECVFLDHHSRLCTVYEKRPHVCRDFPTSMGSRIGFCPYGKILTK